MSWFSFKPPDDYTHVEWAIPAIMPDSELVSNVSFSWQYPVKYTRFKAIVDALRVAGIDP